MSNPTMDFVWRAGFHYDVTPMRTEEIRMPPVSLRVLAPAK
jgi:hypothetical protein